MALVSAASSSSVVGQTNNGCGREKRINQMRAQVGVLEQQEQQLRGSTEAQYDFTQLVTRPVLTEQGLEMLVWLVTTLDSYGIGRARRSNKPGTG